MACDKMGLLISRVLDGEGSEEDSRRVAEHVGACAACREEMEAFQRNEALVEEALGGRDFQEEVVNRVLRQVPSPVRRSASPAIGALLLRLSASPGAVAAAILLACVGFFAYQTLALQAVLLRASAALPQTPATDPTLVNQYADMTRHYQSLLEKLIDEHRRNGRSEPAVVADHPTSGGEPAEKDPGIPERQTIKSADAVVQSAPDGALQVQPTVVDEGIQVDWKVAKEVQPTGFRLYRRAAAEPEFAKPIEIKSGESYFIDRNLKPKTKYTYKLEAVTPTGAPKVTTPEFTVESSGDLKVQFIGIGVATGAAPQEARLRVSKWVSDRWQEQTFVVRDGEPIGKKVNVPEVGEVDFTTGWTMLALASKERVHYTQETIQMVPGTDGKLVRKTHQKEWVQNEPWIELLDKSDKMKGLWKGDIAVGTQDSIED